MNTLINYIKHCSIVLIVTYLIFCMVGRDWLWYNWSEPLRGVFYIMLIILLGMMIFGIDINDIRNKK